MSDYLRNYANRLNENLRHERTDIEWRVSDSGELYLTERADFTKKHTQWLKAKAAKEQRDWIEAQRKAAEYDPRIVETV